MRPPYPKFFFILTSVLVFSTCERAIARPLGNDRFSVDMYQSVFQNVSLLQQNNLNLPPSIDLEISWRFYKTFSMRLIGSSFSEGAGSGYIQGSISQFGVGFKVDLPGFFFLGAKQSDLSRVGKRWPICTSAFLDLVQIQAKYPDGAEVSGISNRFGVVTDAFLFNPLVYLSVRGGGFNYRGDNFTFYSVGLGAIF